VLIGAVSGLRSQLGAAGVAATTAPRQLPGGTAVLAHPAAKAVSAVQSAGEFTADKVPSTPDRRTPAGLAPRVLNGAAAAAALGAGQGGTGGGAGGRQAWRMDAGRDSVTRERYGS
jgi:uncharacterized membrane protein